MEERARAEGSADTDEQRRRAWAAHCEAAALETDADGRILRATQRVLESLAGGDQRKHLLDLVHPEDAAALRDLLQQAGAQLSDTAAVLRTRHGGDEWRWCELWAHPFRTSTGDLHYIARIDDVSARVDEEERLRAQLEDERRTAELSRSLLKLDLHDAPSVLRDALRQAAQVADADRAQLLSIRPGPSGGIDRYTWDSPEIPTRDLETLEPERLRRFPWILGKLLAGEVVHVPSLDALPEEAAPEREGFEANGVKAFLALPVQSDDRVVGYLDFRCVRAEREWSQVEIERLRLIAEVFASVLQRKSAEEARRDGAERFETMTENRNAELELRLRLETSLSDLSRRLLAATTDEIDDSIRYGLRVVAHLGGADRAFLLSLPEGSTDLPAYFEHCSDALPARSSFPTTSDRESFPTFSAKLLAGEMVQIADVEDLPEGLPERERLLRAKVRSYLLMPAISRGRLVGVLGLQCVSSRHEWQEPEIAVFRLVADLATGALRRKRSECALQESEERFRALAENSQDPICEISAEGVILYASPAFAKLLERRRSDLEGCEAFDLVHEDEQESLRIGLEDAFDGDLAGTMLFRLPHRDGSWVHVEASARAFCSAAGEPRLVAVLRDVTERERSRRVLERQFEMERRVAELSRVFLDLESDAIATEIQERLEDVAEVGDAEHCWLYAADPEAPGGQRLFQWSRGDDDDSPQPPPPSLRRFSWLREEMLAGRELHVPCTADLPGDAAAERADFARRGVRSFLGIPLVSERRFVGFLGFETISRDQVWSQESITLLRLVGEIFLSALRRRQADGDLQESQAQLLQSQKMEAIGTLAGGIAHDFNNHLAVMLGNASYLLGQVDNEDLRDALGDLQRSAEHCAQLTRSLLAFARRSAVSVQPVHVADVIAGVQELARPLLPSSIEFDTRTTSSGDAVQADPVQLRQVLINLLVNARDAMPEGGRLVLETRRRTVGADEAWKLGLAAPGGYVELLVSDTGVGMDEGTRARIFEPFFTTKELGQGTGLGLATAYGIVHQSGGAIAVETKPGEGTTFTVLLPRLREDGRDGTPSPGREPLPGSETLLVVEDEPAVRRLLGRLLRDRGYHIIEAADGIEALELAEGASIDALVTDLVMPRLGGFELARRLRETHPAVGVLFLSGEADASPASPSEAVGSALFLQKPFEETELFAGLRELLEPEDDDR